MLLCTNTGGHPWPGVMTRREGLLLLQPLVHTSRSEGLQSQSLKPFVGGVWLIRLLPLPLDLPHLLSLTCHRHPSLPSSSPGGSLLRGLSLFKELLFKKRSCFIFTFLLLVMRDGRSKVTRVITFILKHHLGCSFVFQTFFQLPCSFVEKMMMREPLLSSLFCRRRQQRGQLLLFFSFHLILLFDSRETTDTILLWVSVSVRSRLRVFFDTSSS